MSTALRSPSNMKGTGLSWIPDIPSHWEVKRAKLILREVDSRSANGDEVLLSVSQYTGVTPRKNRDNSDEQDTRSESLVGYKKVSTGDLVVNIMLAWNGSLGASNFDGVVSPAYCIYRFEGDNHPDYYHHLLRTDAYKGRIKVDSKGVVDSRLRLYSENLFRIELPVPPPHEQAQIVRFIRHLDQRVNRLIKTKRRLIELLNEQKQAIIHRAVTRGLDPTVPLKPSGIEWLGDIPEHWRVVRLRSLARSFQTGPFGSQLHSHEYVDGGIPVVNPKHMVDGRIMTDPSCSITEAKAVELARHRSLPGEILFARRGELGRCALVTPEHHGVLCGTGSIKMSLIQGSIEVEFLITILSQRGTKEWLSLRSVGSTMENLNTGILGSVPVVLPPPVEQRGILDSVASETVDIEKAVEAARSEIDLIREYRTRLVADVVTGQLDVRHLDLPEVEESLIEAIDADSEEDSELADEENES